MSLLRPIGFLACSLLFLGACSDSNEGPAPTPSDDQLALSGGETTVFLSDPDAFGTVAPNVAGESFTEHEEGDELFDLDFVADAGLPNSGLGPRFNNISCSSCHESDGRGRPPAPGEKFESILLRVSTEGQNTNGGPLGLPGFGDQLQLRAIPGFQPEADASITWQPITGTFSDGLPYSLRKPTFVITDGFQPLPGGLLVSPRVGQAVFGLGLLEAVDESTILSHADPADANGDGISGRPNYVWDRAAGQTVIGRFGWKANQPTLRQQTASAFNGDMGVTSNLLPAENCEGTPGCEAHAAEASDEVVDLVTHYIRTLGVPARRELQDARARRGSRLFAISGCANCHLPELRTGSLPGVPEVSNQVIRPYTDLLLHDMGPGLADGRPDFQASPSEWRTPPIWGIGLTQTVSNHTEFLHDGRARSLEEAILWHGGEAEKAQLAFRKLAAGDRAALLAFLNSL
ncbi:MAG: di-heme oxidoredictase family protein [Gemmatimonadales bacterium]